LFLALFIVLFISSNVFPQSDGTSKNSSQFKIARLKYSGGGDWYNDPSAEINMMEYLKKNTTIDVDEPMFYSVSVSSDDIFNYPFILITGHGNIEFSSDEVARLRKYCESGGFLYADDDYGMNDSFRREIRKVFPDEELKELPFTHKIYNSQYSFPNGLPKIHEHDQKPAQGFGIYSGGRLCVFYTYETNISDGWADTKEHQDPPEKREEAFKMGTNIIVYSLMN
ncbi:MAG: DUF4159 domain-containing protein, partial [Ignavibacteria bacterium]